MSTILILNILYLINNGLDANYLIEPFEKGDDILELKRIANQKLEDSNSITIINFALFLSYILINWSYEKNNFASTTSIEE